MTSRRAPDAWGSTVTDRAVGKCVCGRPPCAYFDVERGWNARRPQGSCPPARRAIASEPPSLANPGVCHDEEGQVQGRVRSTKNKAVSAFLRKRPVSSFCQLPEILVVRLGWLRRICEGRLAASPRESVPLDSGRLASFFSFIPFSSLLVRPSTGFNSTSSLCLLAPARETTPSWTPFGNN